MKGFAQQVVVTVFDTASMFETEVHDLLAQVELLFQPPYSLEFNSIEYLWSVVK